MKNRKGNAAVLMNLYCCMYTGCPSEYSTKFNLKRHVESVHMHVKKYKCSTCDILFSSKQSLQEHMHIHTGQMPFKCLTCDKYFRQASQLSLHKRLHVLEGIKTNYSRVDVEQYNDITPIEVLMEVDENKFRLPKIESSRACLCILPSLV